MRSLVIIAIVLLTISVKAQHNFELFLEFGVDPKMAVQGPYKGKPQDPGHGTFNYEVKGGFDFEKQRFGFSYEAHKFINYEKFAVFYDHQLNDKIAIFNVDGFTSQFGLELSIIKRRWPKELQDVVDYRDVTNTVGNWGFNAGLLYNIKYKKSDTGFDIGVNYNVFSGETEFKRWKGDGYWQGFRADVMIILVRRFDIN